MKAHTPSSTWLILQSWSMPSAGIGNHFIVDFCGGCRSPISSNRIYTCWTWSDEYTKPQQELIEFSWDKTKILSVHLESINGISGTQSLSSKDTKKMLQLSHHEASFNKIGISECNEYLKKCWKWVILRLLSTRSAGNLVQVSDLQHPDRQHTM